MSPLPGSPVGPLWRQMSDSRAYLYTSSRVPSKGALNLGIMLSTVTVLVGWTRWASLWTVGTGWTRLSCLFFFFWSCGYRKISIMCSVCCSPCWRVTWASGAVWQRSWLPHLWNCSLLNAMCSTPLVYWINWYSASRSLEVGSNMTRMNCWDIYWREWELRTWRCVGIFVNFRIMNEGEFCYSLALNFFYHSCHVSGRSKQP